jgi:hypothetical protein
LGSNWRAAILTITCLSREIDRPDRALEVQMATVFVLNTVVTPGHRTKEKRSAMTMKTNTMTEGKKVSSLSNEHVFELSDSELDMVVGGLNPQPLPPRHLTA